MIDGRVCGIPCQILVTFASVCAPQGRWADNRDEAEGWEEIEFELYDRRGRRAKWLENKMDSDDIESVKNQLREAANDYDND